MFRQAVQNQFRPHLTPLSIQSRANAALLNSKWGVSRRTFSTSSATQAPTAPFADVKPPTSMAAANSENLTEKQLVEKATSPLDPHVESSTTKYTMDELFNPTSAPKGGVGENPPIPQIIRPMLNKNATGTFHVTEFHSSPQGGTFSKEYHGKYSPDHGLTLNQKHITHSEPKLPASLDPKVCLQNDASEKARQEFIQKNAENEAQQMFDQMQQEADEAFDQGFRSFSSAWPFSAPFAHHPRFFRHELGLPFGRPQLTNAANNVETELAANGEQKAVSTAQQKLQTSQPGQNVGQKVESAVAPQQSQADQQSLYDVNRNFDHFGPYEMMDNFPVHPWFGPMTYPFPLGRRSPFSRFEYFDDIAKFPDFGPFAHFNRLGHFGADAPGHYEPMHHFGRRGMRGHGRNLGHNHHPSHPQHPSHHHPGHQQQQQPHPQQFTHQQQQQQQQQPIAQSTTAQAASQHAEQKMTDTMNANNTGVNAATANTINNSSQTGQNAAATFKPVNSAATATNGLRNEQVAQNVNNNMPNAPQTAFQDQSHHHLHPSSYYDTRRGFTPESFDHWIHDVHNGMHDYNQNMRNMARFAKKAEKAFRRENRRRDPFDDFFGDFGRIDPFGNNFNPRSFFNPERHGRFWI